jgi:metallo-beta-lactamase family protein
MSDISLTFFGAAGTVTGSCTLVQFDDKQILVDCGMIQGSDEEVNKNRKALPFVASELTAIVMTHGHLDHTGRIPLLVSQGFKGKIYTHPASSELATIIWNDSVKLKDNGQEPLYNEETVHHTEMLVFPLQYEQKHTIDAISITLFDSGHILGSSHALIEYKGKRILFSGDIGVKNTPIIRDPNCKWADSVDAVVIESTYGNRFHKDREKTILEFKDILKRIIKEKGVLLIPAFAIGRTQEILYHLNTLVEQKQIPVIPVFVDSPMANRVTQIYRKYIDCYDDETAEQIRSGDLPLEFTGLHNVISSTESRAISRTPAPFIVIAGSGMCNGGRILHHLKQYVGRKSTTIMFVGWQGEGTLGRKLIDGAENAIIGGEYCDVLAKIETLNGFSAHADQAGLIEWAKSVPGKNIQWFVNHGEKAASLALADVLNSALLGNAVSVNNGQNIAI